MITITYGIFAEDSAIKVFIEKTLPQLVPNFGFHHAVQFEHAEDFTNFIIATGKDYVKEKFMSVVAHGVKTYALELCFVGLDADEDEHDILFNQMNEKLAGSHLEHITLVFIPVQCIEYWLWYLKTKLDDLSLVSTPVIDGYNLRKDKEIKKLVYGKKRINNQECAVIITELTKNIDFDWLNAHSASFKHFYNLFHDYLKKNFGVAL
ncbi:MAG: hypothetical protein H6577_05495 [Lewinellaceae bacterium]|nr:hypothetical protein [Saprospiraceae bacterium]MCB9337559.1 hypothetical protein [Lewinellaceae bacterium]